MKVPAVCDDKVAQMARAIIESIPSWQKAYAEEIIESARTAATLLPKMFD